MIFSIFFLISNTTISKKKEDDAFKIALFPMGMSAIVYLVQSLRNGQPHEIKGF